MGMESQSYVSFSSFLGFSALKRSSDGDNNTSKRGLQMGWAGGWDIKTQSSTVSALNDKLV